MFDARCNHEVYIMNSVEQLSVWRETVQEMISFTEVCETEFCLCFHTVLSELNKIGHIGAHKT